MAIRMDAILKALSDKTRRELLDRLRERDGQTLTELEASLGMTRFGVMKHLKLLESAGLVLTRKAGRFKYHYLNAAPLQSVVDRWIEPLTRQAATRALLDLKAQIEGENTVQDTMTKPDFMLETYIAASPERVWEALTSSEITRQYNIMGGSFQGMAAPGTHYNYLTPDGNIMLSGEIIAADPPHRLEMTFLPGWLGPDTKASRNVYEIEADGDHSKLTILHYDIPEDYFGVREGWAKIAASLKTLLETGNAIRFG
jgi:uncharacterized protein YndB with AHSA1/START domain/DNA-binding transcriptional ArsR family regulator